MHRIVTFQTALLDAKRVSRVQNEYTELFNRIYVCEKPLPGTGFWGAEYTPGTRWLSTWHEFCETEAPERLGVVASLFSLKPDARIYTIDTHMDLVNLVDGLPPVVEGITAYGDKAINFEAAAVHYDAMHLTQAGCEDVRAPYDNWSYRLTKWDVASVLVLNPEVIDETSIREVCVPYGAKNRGKESE